MGYVNQVDDYIAKDESVSFYKGLKFILSLYPVLIVNLHTPSKPHVELTRHYCYDAETNRLIIPTNRASSRMVCYMTKKYNQIPGCSSLYSCLHALSRF